jgi:hypothetical protein
MMNTELFESNDKIQDLPVGMIRDISVTHLQSMNPYITNIIFKNRLFFVSFEDPDSEELLGEIIIKGYPKKDQVYFSQNNKRGFSASIILENVTTQVSLQNCLLKPLAQYLIKLPDTPFPVRHISTNGVSEEIPSVLVVRTDSRDISIYTDTRSIEGLEQQCLVISRDDTSVSQEFVYRGYTSNNNSETGFLSLNGVLPDTSGNIVIEGYVAPDQVGSIHVNEAQDNAGESIGIVVEQTRLVCPERQLEKIIQHGRCEQGIYQELPLDALVEDLKPEFKQEDCGCDN